LAPPLSAFSVSHPGYYTHKEVVRSTCSSRKDSRPTSARTSLPTRPRPEREKTWRAHARGGNGADEEVGLHG
jgi:hypothetical protein